MLNRINISSKEQILIIYIVLAAITLAVFWQVNQYDFVYDDVVYVTQNRNIQSGITPEGLRWAFSTKYADLWTPLVWISFMVDYQLFGLNAGGYHITNLILHIMSTLLLFWLFNRMTGAIWKSAFVAALFALHPLHVESVAWIAERKDVLSAFFWMLTFCLYVYYTEKPAIRRYLFVLFGFACALMSKPMVITLPVIMILLDYWPLGRFESKKGNLVLWQLKEKTPFFILSAALVIVSFYTPNEQETYIKLFPLSSRIANAPVAFMTYLERTFWPHDMAVFYPFPTQIPVWLILGTFLLIIVITTIVVVMVKRMPFLFVGWMWYAVTIAPVIGIIQVSVYPYAMADRYHYLPSVGIVVMLAWGIPFLIKSEQARKKILFPVGIAFLAIMAFLSWDQCGYWKNSIELWKHALEVTKNNYPAHNNFGLALFAEGKIEEAINHYNKAISIAPEYVYTYNNRGIIYGERGQYKLAIEDFNNAIRIIPTFADAYYNLGFTYDKRGQYQLAIENYNKAIRLKPDYTEAYMNRGIAYLKRGNNTLGCRDELKACALGNCKTLESAKGIGYCP